MELYQVDVRGYRKFKSQTRLKTNGKIVAILGSNEAGKSSLLAAIERLSDNDPFLPHEISFDADPNETKIKATYLLSDDDRVRANAPNAVWFDIEKASDGKLFRTIRPRPQARSTKHRAKLLKLLDSLKSKEIVRANILEVDEDLFVEADALFEEMNKAKQTLSATQIERLEGIAERFSETLDDGSPKYLREFCDETAAAVAEEKAEDQGEAAGKILSNLRPTFLLFGEDDRNLKSSYTISDLTAAVPKALKNLAKVAEMDVNQLVVTYTANSSDALIDTMLETANENLSEKFKAVWKQSAVSVAISIRDQNLLIQVRNPNKRRTDFSQRSDGLRQFVALQSFTTSQPSDNIVLLIDEVEQHLHYDAQASVIQMLASQTVAAKVIYSTHSAGCLPEDLGNGVRLVKEVKGTPDWSEVENKFWHTKDPSFSPLLIGMGASTLAFFPTRVAVVVEGQADMLLYPTMFREALGRPTIGCQFVPGLSTAGNAHLPLLNSAGKRVCYLLDGDDGGSTLKDDLIENEIDENRIVQLAHNDMPCELEDFISSDVISAAVNELGRCHHKNNQIVSSNDMPLTGKWDYVEAQCNEIGIPVFSKVDVVYGILDLIDADPKTKILDAVLAKDFRVVIKKVFKKLDIK